MEVRGGGSGREEVGGGERGRGEWSGEKEGRGRKEWMVDVRGGFAISEDILVRFLGGGGREDLQQERCRRMSNPAGQSLPHFY